MSLSPVRYKILESMLLHDKPATVAEIARETGHKFRAVMMHMIGLTRMGYAASLGKGLYAITEKGKNALGIPEIDKATANAILADMPQDKVFYFYACVGKPLNCCAQSLKDFCDKILKISVASIEFHLNRGDFEAWFRGVGDVELARKTALLKEKGLVGEELRARLREIVENRCVVLAKLA